VGWRWAAHAEKHAMENGLGWATWVEKNEKGRLGLISRKNKKVAHGQFCL
jgi:hypothetical protein